MPKYFKKYNPETKQWEVITLPYEVSEPPSHDTEVVVTNVNYSDGTEETTLDDTLTVISDDINELRRNVSWLAEHGGGGGGGGGGTTPSNFEISVAGITPNASNVAYVTFENNSFSFSFQILNAKTSERFEYAVLFDNKSIKTGNINGGRTVTVTVTGISQTQTTHSLYIAATDPYGLSVAPYSVSIVEQSITISMDKTSFSVPVASRNATVNINVKNSIRNSETTLIFENLRNTSIAPYTETFTSSSTTPYTKSVYWYNICPNATAGSTYTFRVKCEVKIPGTVETLTSNSVIFYATVSSSDVISIALSTINDIDDIGTFITEDEVYSVAINEILSFSFTPYKTGANEIYYAAKMVAADENFQPKLDGGGNIQYQRLLLGNYYDDDLKNEGATSYRDNTPPTTTGGKVTCSWYANDNDYIGNVLIYIRCWAGSVSQDKIGVFKLNEAGEVFIGFQNPDNCCFARWGAHQNPMSSPDADKWVSNMRYKPVLGDGSLITNTVTMNVFNTNGVVNGYLPRTNSLRLQSNAYASIDLSSFREEMAAWYTYDSTVIDNPCEGFTISITFKADQLPDDTKTVFMFGHNFDNGTLNEGMRIDINKVYWYAGGTKLEALIRENVKTTVDFVYLKNNGEPIIKLYVNGILTQARNATIENLYDTIYLAYKGNLEDLSNINIYDLAIFGNVLGDTELIINAKNAKIDDFSSEAVIEDYIKWKNNNMFYMDEEIGVLRNRLYENGTYLNPTFDEIKSIATIPILYLQSQSDGEFTRSYFLNTTTNENVTGEENAKDKISATYYDPNSGKEAINLTNLKVGIQGTSSTNYRSKNLELYLCGLIDGATEANQYELFQPRDDWFPEREFTLKADVMDSSHANNAVLGAWINRCGSTMFENNPAQEALSKIENRPHDIAQDGTYLKDDENNYVYQTAPTVKHTIEGFPIILIARFADEDGYDGSDVFLGIYSFNLGRYSHYNLGMRFLKSFTRRSGSAWSDEGTPALIKKYEIWPQDEPIVYQTGSFVPRDVYAYEFEATADENNNVHPTWSQEDVSVLQYMGKFRYNGATMGDSVPTTDQVWRKLSSLFEYTAGYPPTYDYYYINSENQYQKDPSKQHSMNVYDAVRGIKERFNARNASAYFVLAVAHGLTDSLGKNLTLRTWNANDEKPIWWTAFYDMDSAHGLNNMGAEAIKSDAYIDAYENKGVYKYEDEQGVVHTVNSYYALPTTSDGNIITNYSAITWNSDDGPNDLIITRNYSWSQFSSYTSKIWNILRSTKESGEINEFYNEEPINPSYEQNWATLRRTYLTSADVFANLMENQMGDCGEMVFNSDYNFKYLSKYKKTGSDVETYGDIDKLHGNRVEYVRKWLQDRIYYFDGVFELSTNTANIDSPYISNTSIGAAGKERGYPELTVRTSCPFIFVAGLDANKKRYYVPANTDVTITLISWNANGGKQFQINGNTVLTKLDGLYRIKFQQFESGARLPKLSELNISNSALLNTNPIDFEHIFTYDGGEEGYLSNINTVNLSNTAFANGGDLNVILYNSGSTPTLNYDKLNYVDISNSCVTSLVLPKVPLTYLNIRNSQIASFSLSDQPMLSTLSFDGCTNLTNVNINNCDGLTGLTFSGLTMLRSTTIRNCENLKTLQFIGDNNLTAITINGNNALTSITVDNCTNPNINIDIDIESNTLESLTFNSILVEHIKLPQEQYLGNVTELSLKNCSNLTGFIYGEGGEVLKFEDKDVLDLRPFESLNVDENGLDVSNMFKLRYVSFRDDSEKPFKLYNGMFSTTVSLNRVFGYISLEGPSIFSDCTGFTLNENDYDYESEETLYENDDFNIRSIEPSGDLVANIVIDSPNMTKCFMNTNCTIFDVYYILSKCDNVSNMSQMFAECTNLSPGIRNRYVFEHCGNVTNVNEMFIDCRTTIYLFDSSMDDYGHTMENGTFSYFVSLKNMSAMFDGNYLFAECWNDGLFNSLRINPNEYLPITSITSFNPTFTVETYAYSLLRSLPDLEVLSDSFNMTSMLSFVPEDGTTDCHLFYNNTKLRIVRESFRGIGLGHDSDENDTLKNLFGGDYPSDTEHYPQKLEEISQSFTFVGDEPWIELPINNNFFSKVYGTLTALKGDDNAKTLSGNGLHKYIDGSTFPFDIFRNCAKLTSVEYFFKDVEFPSQGENVVLPGNMFENNTKLSSLKGCFSEAKFKYELEPSGFIPNTALTDVSYIFSNNTETGGLNGEIPYKLFFFGDTFKNYPNSVGVTKDTFEGLSSYVSDTDDDGNVTLTGITASEITQTTFSGQYSTPITRLRNIEGAFSHIRSNYTLYRNKFNLNGVEHESDFSENELIIENPEYCPIMFTVSSVDGGVLLTKNPSYNPYRYMWNIFAYDGNGDAMHDMITASTLYSKLSDETSDVYGLLPLDTDEFFPVELNTGYINVVDGSVGQHINGGSQVNERNYICPPDLLRYCNDIPSLNVTSLFESSDGMVGNIPEMLFYPLKSLTSVSGVFKGFNMLPYKFPILSNGVLTEGIMYPPNLFKTLTGLTTISELFRYGKVWGGTVVSADLFRYNANLNDASSVWENTMWYDIEKQASGIAFNAFKPEGLFANNRNLTTIRDMFRNANMPYMESYLFSTTNNPRINDCSYFLGGATGLKGHGVPEFWSYPNMLNGTSAYGNLSRSYNALNISQDTVDRYATSYFLPYIE